MDRNSTALRRLGQISGSPPTLLSCASVNNCRINGPSSTHQEAMLAAACLNELSTDNSAISANDQVFCLVPGRLTLLTSGTRYKVTLGEIRRRIYGPECLNASFLGGILRKAKNKNVGRNLRALLTNYGLHLQPGRRKLAPPTCFTPLVEEEATQMAHDFGDLLSAYYPKKQAANSLLHNAPSSYTADMKQNELVAARCVLRRLFDFHVHEEEKLRANKLDDDDNVLSDFDDMTHTFGNPTFCNVLIAVDEILGMALRIQKSGNDFGIMEGGEEFSRPRYGRAVEPTLIPGRATQVDPHSSLQYIHFQAMNNSNTLYPLYDNADETEQFSCSPDSIQDELQAMFETDFSSCQGDIGDDDFSSSTPIQPMDFSLYSLDSDQISKPSESSEHLQISFNNHQQQHKAISTNNRPVINENSLFGSQVYQAQRARPVCADRIRKNLFPQPRRPDPPAPRPKKAIAKPVLKKRRLPLAPQEEEQPHIVVHQHLHHGRNGARYVDLPIIMTNPPPLTNETEDKKPREGDVLPKTEPVDFNMDDDILYIGEVSAQKDAQPPQNDSESAAPSSAGNVTTFQLSPPPAPRVCAEARAISPVFPLKDLPNSESAPNVRLNSGYHSVVFKAPSLKPQSIVMPKRRSQTENEAPDMLKFSSNPTQTSKQPSPSKKSDRRLFPAILQKRSAKMVAKRLPPQTFRSADQREQREQSESGETSDSLADIILEEHDLFKLSDLEAADLSSAMNSMDELSSFDPNCFAQFANVPPVDGDSMNADNLSNLDLDTEPYNLDDIGSSSPDPIQSNSWFM